MKTLICHEPNSIEYIERDIPSILDNQVLLKINSVGICGTDIHAYAGRQPFFSYPRVLGHEICGTAEKIGEACQSAMTGKRYSVIPCVPCGRCSACHENKTNCCENVSLYGVHRDGGFSEYLAVYEDNLVELPENVSNSEGALVECFAISAHAVRRADINARNNVVVVGAGPIGLAAAAIAKAEGANVVVVDVDAGRREQVATKLGVKALNPLLDDYVSNLKKAFGGELACVLMDATGNKGSMSRSVDLIRHGGKIVFIGLYIGDLVLDDPTFHKKETTLLSSRNATRIDFERVIELMASGAISQDIMKNQDYDFYTFGNSYKQDVVENKELVKGVINF
ncbi:galactonate oxidoreductase [Vibrio sp. 10N.286.49.C2]|uniref:zinc-binding alcohol dehydrogenase family protein n=1 Tax=unclassified Vibrio TaxID=2614977 RepID=UPI000C84C127|nr:MULTISPECIES: zinc-binding alcohol dehydrogenase family protein [unclassified Vibrio]PMH26391.1 galactonate oxidoreductase [Vibrio sp. 10N.286.49.C2]PMH54885.1 galactonate oxidoreductase [Vibrio sp. 10N.286.49.B1]PMH79587.1 galactonate oxidoreductase [Vibrio sp. 10N.286.48.B7]